VRHDATRNDPESGATTRRGGLAVDAELRRDHRARASVGSGNITWAVVTIVLSNVFYTDGESLIVAFLTSWRV
jgi:hypothetical protein